jgi:hypothetical protein
MNRFLMTCTALAAFGLLVPAAPAAAAMDLSSVDCSQAGSMMMMKPDEMKSGDMSMAPSPAPAMTTDQAFDQMSHTMMHHAAMMAGMELKCGKDPASRAQAAKLLQQLTDDGVAEAKDILNQYNH